MLGVGKDEKVKVGVGEETDVTVKEAEIGEEIKENQG